MSKTEYAVFIGRFQPFHNAHLRIIENALEEAEKLIIVVGSYRVARSLRNPWSYEERVQMIKDSVPPALLERITFTTARDYLYCITTWLTGVQNAISQIVKDSNSVKIIGHFKDDSSFYLKLFPQWQVVTQPNFFGANATDVRKELFSFGGIKKDILPDGVKYFLEQYKNTQMFESFQKEQEYLNKYKEKWAASPFPPIFVTTDAVVVQAGHVLLIKRGMNPGKGMYALPGGFLGKNEQLLDSCLRELKEETNILFYQGDGKRILQRSMKDNHVFDHPSRDLRGRTLTHAFYFHIEELGPLPEVKGGDDASEAVWVPISDLTLHEENFFSDHFHIINYFIRGIGR